MRTAPYAHRVPREEVDEVTRRRECSACGEPTTGIGDTLRHVGEAVRPTLPASPDVDAFTECVLIAASSQERLPAHDISRNDVARVIVEDLYAAGALRTRRSTWNRSGRRRRVG